jgi:DNA-binding MarR family transcriptional regulator
MKKEPLESLAAVELLKAANWMTTRAAAFFREYDITPTQYNVLRILRGAGGELHPSDIGDRMIDQGTDMTRLIDRMVRDGLVGKRRCDEDRRAVWVTLTGKGRKLVDRMDQPTRAFNRGALGHMKASDLKTLKALLEKLQA